MTEVQITSQFIFDVFLQKGNTNPRKLTQIKITCPPDYGVAKVMAKHIISQIINDREEIPLDESKETAMISVKLGNFAYDAIDTFEQSKSWFSKNE